MNDSRVSNRRQRASRRDLFNIPAIVVLTIVFLGGISEGLALWLYPSRNGDTCTIHDAAMGIRFKQNCTSEQKVPEGPWTQNFYNDCGSRSPFQCSPKPKDGLRIVIFGNSISQGSFIPYDDTYGSRVATELTKRCGQPVDVQNVARPTYTWKKIVMDLDEALALNPSVAITTITPNDLESDPAQQAVGSPNNEALSLQEIISNLTSASRALYVAKDFYYRNSENFATLYLHYREKANFLRPPFSAFWQTRLAAYDELLGKMAEKADSQKVPLVLVFVPQQAQAVLLGMKRLPQGVDPRAFSEALAALAARHGIFYVDTSEAFGRFSNPTDLYYGVNGHPSGAGHAVMAKAVVTQLLKTDRGPFQSCRSPTSDVSGNSARSP